jgi:hypothetical protein
MATPEAMKDIYEKYKERIEKELGSKVEKKEDKVVTREYKQFKAEFMPTHLSLYEKLCNQCEKIVKIKPDKKKEDILRDSIKVCHLNMTPSGVASFAILIPLLVIVFGSLSFYMFFNSMFFVAFFLFIGISLVMPLGKLPIYLANSWRLKASNQMVLCIFYVVTYMRHTSNLELAIEFAAEHLAPPISLDLKKVLWDVETEKYESVQESLTSYLQSWKRVNQEFIEAFHLIESSLYESSEDRRLSSLDKSLDGILNETYEKMLHYAHNLKSPITMLHMLGVILPILSLVILPLAISFMEEVKWFHLAAIYNIALPFAVYYLGKGILSTRPTGYGDVDISESNPELKKYKYILIKIGKAELKISPLYLSVLVAVVLGLIGLSPVIIHTLNPYFDIPIGEIDETSLCGAAYCLLGYDDDGKGPFGLGASILSLSLIMAFGAGLGLYYKLRSKNVIVIRNNAKNLEKEFANALFQLGNRLGNGIPAEMAVGRVAESMEGTASGSFFQIVSQNIRRIGMSVQQAIFDPQHGALVYFPSNMIESSMKVLIESIKKGPRIAAEALMNVSRYIKEIHKVNERLKDLMADIISSMTSQIKFLTPVIAGIVVGITSMISTIIIKLTKQIAGAGAETGLTGLAPIFQTGLPTFYFQIIVGIYVVQIVYILTVTANGIENGSDKLAERFNLGKNLIRSTVLYCFVAFAIMLIFNSIAGRIIGTMGVGGI